MKYLVISDLHIPERAKEIPIEIIKEAEKSKGIICAGDFTIKEVYEKLKLANGNIIAVKGNCDNFNLPDFVELQICNKKIGVIHSHQFGRGNIELILKFAKSKKLNVLIFGHTHLPFNEKMEDILILNPGSANGIVSGNGIASEKTYALLNIEKEVNSEIIRID